MQFRGNHFDPGIGFQQKPDFAQGFFAAANHDNAGVLAGLQRSENSASPCSPFQTGLARVRYSSSMDFQTHAALTKSAILIDYAAYLAEKSGKQLVNQQHCSI